MSKDRRITELVAHITQKIQEGDATTVLIAEIAELRYGIEELRRQTQTQTKTKNVVTTDNIDRKRRFGQV